MGVNRLVYALVVATIPAGCGSNGTCEEGTVQIGGTCYAHDPNDVTPPQVTVDPPVHTRTVGDVRLTTDEHAVIYYTTDGSLPTKTSLNEADNVLLPGLADDAVISFFAVDVNGNASPVQTVRWDIDRTGPGAPTPMDIALTGDMRTVTWTPPVGDPHLAGVLVARVEGALAASPESGKRYYPGQTLGAGTTVVAVVAPGFTGQFAESHASTPGLVRYLAWSFDDIYNYGPAAGDYAVTTIGPQTGTVSINAGTGAVTATAQPSHLMFSGSAVLNGSDLTVSLDVTNATSRVLFAPKVLLTNTLSTQTFDNSDGTFDTFEYRALGPAINPGSKATVVLEFGNVTNTDVLSLALDVRDNDVLVAGHWADTVGSVVDEATETELGTFHGGTAFKNNFEAHGAGITPDGRWITGSRNNAVLGSYDIATGERLLTNTLAVGKYFVRRLILDPSGSAGYALLSPGHVYGAVRERRGLGVESTLVTFDASTLRETGRLALGSSRSRSLALSPDGRWLAVATDVAETGVIIVNLAELKIARNLLDETAATATGVAFTPDSKSLVVAGAQQMNVYTVADGTQTKHITLPVTTDFSSFDCVFGPDGRVWFGRKNELVAVDLTTGTPEVLSYDSALLHVSKGKLYVAESGDSSVERIDTAGTSETTLSFETSIYGHSLSRSPF